LLVHHLANIALFPHLIIFSAREKGTRPRLSAPKVVQKCVLSHNSLFLWIKVDEKDAWIASKRQKQKFVVVTYIPSAESDQGNVVFVPSLELLACYVLILAILKNAAKCGNVTDIQKCNKKLIN
jgi:hypothetical protein